MTKTALIIDDNKANRDVLTMMLKTNGVSPVSLDSPRFLADSLAQIDHIDVVFLDLEFPNYNGLDLVNYLREQPTLSGAPIVAYTVHTSEVETVRDAGFDGFLGKPLKPHRFAGQLQRILNGDAVWEE
ncbi:MAG: response regulator [Anaerolinea sp.]|nr:response regulator [Anaerolinea sp.]